jgi:hypothetical protein
MISFDIETCGVKTNSVLLSVACIRFNLDDSDRFDGDIVKTYQNYIDSALFVKFAVEMQVKTLHRTLDKEAMEWWAKQCLAARTKSLIINGTELQPKEGIDLIKEYCFFNDTSPTLWQRGGLDQVVFDDFCRDSGVDPIFQYWNWQDFRTAINLCKNTANRGYCTIPEFNRSLVVKHDPVHDAAYDVLQLIYGE